MPVLLLTRPGGRRCASGVIAVADGTPVPVVEEAPASGSSVSALEAPLKGGLHIT